MRAFRVIAPASNDRRRFLYWQVVKPMNQCRDVVRLKRLSKQCHLCLHIAQPLLLLVRPVMTALTPFFAPRANLIETGGDGAGRVRPVLGGDEPIQLALSVELPRGAH